MDRRHRPNHGLICLDPVWLFSDDLEELVRLLSELGKTRIVMDGPDTDNLAEITRRRSLGWLRLLVPTADVSVTLHPTCATVAWADAWHPAQTERDVVSEVVCLLESHRHPLYYLQKTDWQAVAAAATLFILLLAAALYVRGRPILPLTSFGIFWGILVLAWIVVGRFMPSRKHLALFSVGQREFKERSIRRMVAIVAAVVLLVVGFLIGLFVGWTTYFWPSF